MKTYSKTHCPDSIEYKGDVFKLNVSATHKHREGVKLSAKYHIQVKVLSRNLKGKNDLHGNLYTPNVFIYSNDIGFMDTRIKDERPAVMKELKRIKSFGY